MPISSRRCGMITKREAERLCKSFLGDNSPPKLPENFAFEVRSMKKLKFANRTSKQLEYFAKPNFKASNITLKNLTPLCNKEA